MTIKAPTKDELKFLKLLLSGRSTRGAARDLGISSRQAYNMAEKLTYLGFIRPIPGTKSPVVYEKGDLDYSFIEGRCKLGQGAANGAPSPPREIRPAPDPVRGVSTDPECPEGFVEAHVNGSMSFTIVKVGSFDDPQIPGIGYVGFWCDRKSGDMEYGMKTPSHHLFGVTLSGYASRATEGCKAPETRGEVECPDSTHPWVG